MTAKVEPVPEGHHTVTPYLMIKGAARAIAAGGREIEPVADQFYGDRRGGVQDPFGYVWWIATHKEDVSLEQISKRAAAAGRR